MGLTIIRKLHRHGPVFLLDQGLGLLQIVFRFSRYPDRVALNGGGDFLEIISDELRHHFSGIFVDAFFLRLQFDVPGCRRQLLLLRSQKF